VSAIIANISAIALALRFRHDEWIIALPRWFNISRISANVSWCEVGAIRHRTNVTGGHLRVAQRRTEAMEGR
jgi:hypothetical protein